MMVVVTAATVASANVNESGNAAFGNDGSTLLSTASNVSHATGSSSSSNNNNSTASSTLATDEPEVVDVPSSTPHVLLSSGERGEQFYQVNDTCAFTQHWTYVVRVVLSVEQSSSIMKAPYPSASPPRHLSSVITCEQWNELWLQRVRPIQEELLPSEQWHHTCCDAARTLMVFPIWLSIVFGFSWSQNVLYTCSLASFSAAFLLYSWSYKRTIPHRMRAWQSFCKLCDDINTTWLSLHQHGWTAECHYEQWRFLTVYNDRGCRLYFLPIQPRGLSLSPSSDQNQNNKANTVKATALDQNGSVCILLSSKPQSTTDRWLTWTPLALDNKQKVVSPTSFSMPITNETSTTTAAFVTGEDMETTIFSAADVGRLLREQQQNGPHQGSGQETQTDMEIDDTGRTNTNTDMADVWSRFWFDWQVAATRYNRAHRVSLVAAVACLVTVLVFFGTLAVVTYFEVRLVNTKRVAGILCLSLLSILCLSLFAALVLWGMTLYRKHMAFCNLEEVMKQHCFDFIDDNIFMEFRTVATLDEDGRRRNRHGIGLHWYSHGVFGPSHSMKFAHYLYLYRIPPKVSPPRRVRLGMSMENGRPMKHIIYE